MPTQEMLDRLAAEPFRTIAKELLEAQKLKPITDEDREFIKEMKDRMPHLSLYDDMRKQKGRTFP